MDPQLLMMLLPLLLQSGGGGGAQPGVGAPLSALFTGGGPGSRIANLFKSAGSIGPDAGIASSLENLFGLNPQNTALGTDIGSLFGIGGGLLGGALESLFTGVPREQKTQQAEQALAQSGNPMEQLLANFIGKDILGKGNVLSSAGGAGFPQAAQIIEWLSGESLPGENPSQGTFNAGGNPLPSPRDISRLNVRLGQSPELPMSEIVQFWPQISQIISSQAPNLGKIAGQVEALIGSTSGQEKAQATGGSTTPGGTGGNALAAAVGAGGGKGPSPSLAARIQELIKRLGSPGEASTGLVGATA